MEIEIQNLDEIVVAPEKFKDAEKSPKFIFRHPSAADIIDYHIHNDISRTASRCFLRFENKPLLKKDDKAIDYSNYAEFIGLGASPVINNIHAECCSKLLKIVLGIKERAEETEKKSK